MKNLSGRGIHGPERRKSEGIVTLGGGAERGASSETHNKEELGPDKVVCASSLGEERSALNLQVLLEL